MVPLSWLEEEGEEEGEEGGAVIPIRCHALPPPRSPHLLSPPDGTPHLLSPPVMGPLRCRGRTARARSLAKHAPGARIDRARFRQIFGDGSLIDGDATIQSCIEDATASAFFFNGQAAKLGLELADFRSMHSLTERTPMPVVQGFCDQRGVCCEHVTPRFDVDGGRELNLLKQTVGTFALLVFMLPKGTSICLANEPLREYHAMLLYDSYLINNWPTSRVVFIEEQHRKDLASARAALKLTNPQLLAHKDVYLYDIFQYTLKV